jgi:hypothetical protein
MSIEILLDLLVSVLFLAVYHADLAPTESRLEFCPAFVAPENYKVAGSTIAPPTEWVLDEDPIADPVPDELIESIGEALGLGSTPIVPPTAKQLRAAAKALGVKNASRMSKASLGNEVMSAMVSSGKLTVDLGDAYLDFESGWLCVGQHF